MKIILLFLLLISSCCFGQNPYTVNGYPLTYEDKIAVSAPPAPSGLELTYTTGNAPTKTLAEWNTFFGTNQFTSFIKVGDVISLYGGTNIQLQYRQFLGNTNIKRFIDYSSCITYVSNYCFYNCTNLTDFYAPKVTTIIDGGFNGCTALVNFYAPLVTSVGLDAFYGTLITKIDFPLLTSTPSSLSSFDNMSYLENLRLYSFTTGISKITGLRLPSLKYLYIPSVQSVGDYTFYYSPLLEEINLHSSTAIGIGQFNGLSSTNTLYIDLSSCTNLGGTTGKDNVFDGITGKTINLTIPHALESDGNINYLKTNNTVTIIYSD